MALKLVFFFTVKVLFRKNITIHNTKSGAIYSQFYDAFFYVNRSTLAFVNMFSVMRRLP